jgi:putative membrane protein
MAAVLFVNHRKLDTKFVLFFLVMFIAGLIVEWIGVHTGVLFGAYKYGDTLGIKLDGIPLMMGINWFLLVYATGTLLQQTPIRHLWLRVPLGALILVLLDLLIEPAAVKFNYWNWLGAAAPVSNYVCWFIIGVLLLLIFELCRFKKQSMVGPVLLASQFIFFLALLSDSLF